MQHKKSRIMAYGRQSWSPPPPAALDSRPFSVGYRSRSAWPLVVKVTHKADSTPFEEGPRHAAKTCTCSPPSESSMASTCAVS